jgi:hypothetical protein
MEQRTALYAWRYRFTTQGPPPDEQIHLRRYGPGVFYVVDVPGAEARVYYWYRRYRWFGQRRPIVFVTYIEPQQ